MAATEENRIAQYILRYLSKNTAAEDTIDGIVDWWLLKEKIRHRKKEVQKVLDELVLESFIVAHESKDSQIHYKINQRKVREIQALLKESEGQRA